MLEIERRKIISDLNYLLNDYSFLLVLADYCNNNHETVIKVISKIIKHAFCIERVDKESYLISDDIVNEYYCVYLNRTKKKNSKQKKNNKIRLTFNLDDDIRISDLIGIKLPLMCNIIDVCNVNKQKQRDNDYQKEKRSRTYQEAMGFSETGFIYTVTEMVKFDRNTIYCHSGLTGDLNIDFNKLYNDERYGNNSNSPLYKTFIDNLVSITKANDIDVTRFGDLYFIGNGRHRILYLMYFNYNVKVPITVNKRIEDEEFNIIICRLINNYKISFNKNNICNDEADILINYNGKTYNTKNIEELKRFEYLLDNGMSLDEYFVADLVIYSKNDDCNKYKEIRNKIFTYYFENKDKNIFEGNYTDFLKVIGEPNSNLLFESFNLKQRMYQRYKLFGLDFDEELLSSYIDSKDIRKNNKVKKKGEL